MGGKLRQRLRHRLKGSERDRVKSGQVIKEAEPLKEGKRSQMLTATQGY